MLAYCSHAGQNELRDSNARINCMTLTTDSPEGIDASSGSKQLFRFRRHMARHWLWRITDETGFFEVGPSRIVLRMPRKGLTLIRQYAVGVPAVTFSAFSSLALWGAIELFLFNQLDAQAWAWQTKIIALIFIILIATFVFVGWPATLLFESLSIIYFFDYLTRPIQTRHSNPVANVTVQQVETGRVRHILRLQLDEPLITRNRSEKEVVVSVIANRQRLVDALAPYRKASSTK